MKSRTSNPNQTPEMLLNELRSLVSKAEEMMGDSQGCDCSDEAESLRESMDGARERLGEMYKGAKQRVVAGARCTDAAIRSHPYQSLGIAVGAGVLLGLLLARRSQRTQAA